MLLIKATHSLMPVPYQRACRAVINVPLPQVWWRVLSSPSTVQSQVVLVLPCFCFPSGVQMIVDTCKLLKRRDKDKIKCLKLLPSQHKICHSQQYTFIRIPWNGVWWRRCCYVECESEIICPYMYMCKLIFIVIKTQQLKFIFLP